MSISFQRLPKKIFKGQVNQIKLWLKQTASLERKHIGKIIYIFCDDEELLRINREFLKHDTLTDIITFDYTIANDVSGEIYISLDRVKENAGKFGESEKQELLRVMAHGILHLCGYKDKTTVEKEQMRKKENKSLKLIENI